MSAKRDLSSIRLAATNSLNTMDDSSKAELLSQSAVLPAVDVSDTKVTI